MIINWYPGHMASAKRMMEENLRIIDAVIMLLDARIPYSSRNPDLDKMLQKSNKQVLVVLNKADLADPEMTKHWLKEFTSKGFAALAVNGAVKSRNEILSALGMLTAPVRERAAARGMKKTVRVLVAGIPNVGKSTLINTLAGKTRAKTGDKAGVTRGKQWISINNYLELLDSPGLLWPRLDNQTAARRLAFVGSVNDEITDKEELALELVKQISQSYPEHLVSRYGVAVLDEPIRTYEAICRKRGLLLKGNEPDWLRGAVMLIDEFRSGKIGRMTFDLPFALLKNGGIPTDNSPSATPALASTKEDQNG